MPHLQTANSVGRSGQYYEAPSLSSLNGTVELVKNQTYSIGNTAYIYITVFTRYWQLIVLAPNKKIRKCYKEVVSGAIDINPRMQELRSQESERLPDLKTVDKVLCDRLTENNVIRFEVAFV